ncbi:ribulose-5-phosphate 4-epimerase-like epimerase or aldolase [Herbaspirillum sp. YR522]|nr:ribulose-5-phosphate 4-epimerase-like epimerase or aldolase [Herbaspirillum sp. YR522]
MSELPPQYRQQQARIDLAALYRMVAHFRMTDLVDTHISLRVPGQDHHFLINAYGVQFQQMAPGDLVKIDPEGQLVGPDRTRRVNVAGFVIHSAIHMARHDLQCVIHTPTPDGIAVACMEQGLLPSASTR